MRTVCGLARQVQRLMRRLVPRGVARQAVAAVHPIAGGRRPLLTDRIGEQRRGGVRLDQVDGTTCGSVVLVALAAWADPGEVDRLDGVGVAAGSGVVAVKAAGFGARFDARQRQVHRETNRAWPQALGTTPWAMVRWLRRNAPGAGPYRVLLVDDMSGADVGEVIDAVSVALAGGRPVPMLVGTAVPRHYVLALGAGDRSWRVYEPTSGSVRALDLDMIRRRALRPVLGFDRLHAVLLPT